MEVRRLLTALTAAQIEATDLEVAEALWLAAQMDTAEPAGAAAGPALQDEAPAAPAGRGPGPGPPDPGPGLGPEPRMAGLPSRRTDAARATLHVPGHADAPRGGQAGALAGRAPAVSPLPNALGVLRALRPLKRRVLSGRDLVIDEEATADRIATERLIMPVLRPALGRWLSVAIVVDAGPSMAVWHSLVGELRTLLQRLGAFRDIRIWYAHTAPGGEVGIHPRSSPAGHLRSPKELIDPSGRQVVLVVSDCVDGKWRAAAMSGPLESWSRWGPVAILQPLPQRLWRRSALHCVTARIHAAEPGLLNHQLVIEPHTLGAADLRGLGVPVPVLEIEPGWLAAWARLIAGTAHGGAEGVVALTRGLSMAGPPLVAPGELTPAEQVGRFRAAASPDAYRLAGYLSAARLTLPVMRLVQRVMLPQTRPAHLAEVITSGLLRQAGAAGDPERTEYEFVEGVREVLLGTVRRSEVVRLAEQTEAFLSARMGRSRDTQALISLPSQRGDHTLPVDSRPFGSVPVEVLRRLGGRFAEIAGEGAEEVAEKPAAQATSVAPRRPADDREHVDVLVVGSGFGGSVAAYRLAEAGLSVVVMERGGSYPPGAFPRSPAEMGRSFWDPSEGLYGLFDVYGFGRLYALVASGLGGGSLIDASVMTRKDERWFVREDPLPGGGYESWPVTRADLDPHYQAVEAMIGVTPYPFGQAPYAATEKTLAMQDAASELGLEWRLLPLAVRFAPSDSAPNGVGLPITPAPYGNLHGSAGRRTCRLCGECMIGCNDGSKNTLDHTYLSAALRQDAELRTMHEVRSIRPRPGGGYDVGYVRHSPDATSGRPRERTISCDRLVLAAGTFGTARLLLGNRAALPALSRALGTRFSTNGDLLTFLRQVKDRSRTRPLDASRGPVITSAIRLPDGHDAGAEANTRGAYIEDGGYPGFLDWAAQPAGTRSAFRTAQSAWQRLRGMFGGESSSSGNISELIAGGPLGIGSLPLLGLGRDVPDGVIGLRDGELTVRWSAASQEAYFRRVRRTMLQMSHVLGADYLDDPKRFAGRPLTIHPLGGAAMGRTPDVGVCDPYGEVFGHPGLYIADGAAMPGPVGPNPALTIAALADRMCTRLLESGAPPVMVAATQPPPPARLALDTALRTALAGADTVHVIEIGAEELKVTAVRADPGGVLRATADTTPWAEAAPVLSPDAGELSFQLAGGIGAAEQSTLAASLAGGLPARIPAADPVVIVCPVADWPVPALLVRQVRELHPAAPLIRRPDPPVSEVVAEVARNRPLRHPYELVVAEVDPQTRDVRLSTQQLFPAGTTAGAEAQFSIEIPVPHPSGTTLAVVTGLGAEPHVVSLGTTRLPRGTHQFRAHLDRPGQVRMLGPGSYRPGSGSLRDLMAAIPERLGPAIETIELYCAVELGGPREMVDLRLRLIHELTPLLGPEVQPILLGYRDHDFRPRKAPARVVVRSLRPAEMTYEPAAPVEDLLNQVLLDVRKGPKDPARRRVLVTVGRRGPHPAMARATSGVLPCPERHDWQLLLRRLQQEHDVACLAVLDEPDTAHSAWRLLGAQGLRGLANTGPHQLRHDIEAVVLGSLALPVPVRSPARQA